MRASVANPLEGKAAVHTFRKYAHIVCFNLCVRMCNWRKKPINGLLGTRGEW